MRDVVARPERPSLWTLPITAFRVTPPSLPAIWLALSPSPQSFLRSSTRSSFQAIVMSLLYANHCGAAPDGRLTLLTGSDASDGSKRARRAGAARKPLCPTGLLG